MHSVRTAPWQRHIFRDPLLQFIDALRADSAVAKNFVGQALGLFARCTPCGQRRGKGLNQWISTKDVGDALRADSAVAKYRSY